MGSTPFLAATGRGFGAFHVYISKPLRNKLLLRGTPLIGRAAAAASYAVREVTAAAAAASSQSALKELTGPLQRLASNLHVIERQLDQGGIPDAAIIAARAEVNAIARAALAAGQAIQEVTPSLK